MTGELKMTWFWSQTTVIHPRLSPIYTSDQVQSYGAHTTEIKHW